ncbi:unnamed protein product [Rhizophagus irregularis]|nr:unnamed protein product [Rhizophagus irregularis]
MSSSQVEKRRYKELYNNAPTAYVHVYFTPKCSNSVVQNGLNQEFLLENLVLIETLPRKSVVHFKLILPFMVNSIDILNSVTQLCIIFIQTMEKANGPKGVD